MKADDIKEDSFHLLQGQLVDGFLFLNTAFGLPTLLASISRTTVSGWKQIFIIQVFIYSISVITVLLRKRLSLNWRIVILLLQLFTLGITGLISYGFLGSGFMILMTFCLVTTILLGIRRGMYSVGASLIVLVFVGGLFVFGKIVVAVDATEYQSSILSWLSKALGFTLFTASIAFGFNRINHYLNETLAKQKGSALKNLILNPRP